MNVPHLQRRRPSPIWLCLLFLAGLAPICLAETPAANARVNGEWTSSGALRVMRVWGTAREQGYAQGYLLGEDAIKLLDLYLSGQPGGPDAIRAYEATTMMMNRTMKIARPYQDEMHGFIDGLKAKLGDKTVVPALGRPIEYRDVLAVNCIPETARMGCSSFAVWGALTENGGTISGRNLDWFRNAALDGTQYAVARVAGPADKSLGWVSITWPGFIGCLTGMNSEGVTVSVHDAPGAAPSRGEDMTPRGLALREALESAHARTVVPDITAVLKKRHCFVGNNVPVSYPHQESGPASVVFEYDGDLDNGSGVTVRTPGDDKSAVMQACTNHYRARSEPTSCDRYERIDARLSALVSGGGRLDVPAAWEILRSVQVRGRIVTYQSVVFEPNERRIHVAISAHGEPATQNAPVTLDVAALLAPVGK